MGYGGTYTRAVAGAQPHQCAQSCQHQVSLGRVQQLHQQPHTITLEDLLCSSLFSCQHDQVLCSLGKKSSVWITATHCAQETAGSCRHPPSTPVLGSVLRRASLACPGSTSWPRSNNPPLLSSQPQPHCAPLPEAQTFCFLSASFSSRSSKIWNICSTFESVQDMAFICDRAERVAQPSPSPATHRHSGAGSPSLPHY